MAVATTAMVVMASVAIATAVIATTITTITVATATTAMHWSEVFGSSITHNKNLTCKAHVFTCQWVIEVHCDVSEAHCCNQAVDAISIGGHHGNDCSGFDFFVVKLAVNNKNVIFIIKIAQKYVPQKGKMLKVLNLDKK